MNRIILFVILCMAVLFLAGCVTSSPVAGAFYTEVKYDGVIGDGSLSTQKMGQACAKSILGAVAFGDASIDAAKKDGGITKIAYVDREATNIWFFYAKYCTTVRGE